MATGSTVGSRVIRLLLGFLIVAVMLTIFGVIEISKELGGTHGDFSTMDISDFKKGDILHGTITETLGCAATIETSHRTFFIETSKRTSAYYYVIPYFESVQSDIPTKIVYYKTGNTVQAQQLEDLAYETAYMYYGETADTKTHITVDRAEVMEMSAEEYGYLRDLIKEFVDIFYEGYDTNYYFNSYMNAIVPYVVQFNAANGSPLLMIGLGMLFVLGIIILVLIFAGKRREKEPEYTYVSPQAQQVPYDLSGMRQPTAPDRYGTAGQMQMPPAGNVPMPPPAGNYGAPQQVGHSVILKRYEGVDDRPLPPLEGEEKAVGQPGTVPGSGTVRPNLYEDEFSKYVPYSALHEHREVSDSMPSVDPRSMDEVDLSNGGTENSGQVTPNIVTPHSNGIPIINPDLPERDTDESFGSKLDIPEMPKAPEIPRYTGDFPAQPAHPIVSPDIQSSMPGAMPGTQPFPTPPSMPEAVPAPGLEVQPTDPEMRNIYTVGGHLMEEVDPYTEKNVDLSNGGRELPD